MTAAEEPFRVLATSGVFEPGFRGGGPVRSIARIVDTVSEQIELTLVTRDRDLGADTPYPGLSGRWTTRGRARVFYLDTGAVAQWLRLSRHLQTTRFDLLYVNSLWQPLGSVLPIFAARLGLLRTRRVLLAPRGELTAGALSLKAGKKRLFLKVWAPVLKSMDVTWHASTEREAADIRTAFPWARVEINQNQTALPDEPLPVPATPAGPARLVFIGRISPMKNLELVLQALDGLAHPAEFDIYGPLEDTAYWRRCQELIRRLPATVPVRYRGELAPAEVRDTFAGYDASVLPTLGENFGHVIAESLSASCPVICSDRTPWTDILEAGGGQVIRDLTPGALRTALERVAGAAPRDRLTARHAAAGAYRSWRQGVPSANILDQTRLALASSAS